MFVQVLAEMDPDDILAKQVEQLEKEKRELQEKLKAQEKKVSKQLLCKHFGFMVITGACSALIPVSYLRLFVIMHILSS